MSLPVYQLPANGWKARHYQKPLWRYLCHGGKRAIAIWHRRAGKDDVGLNYAACLMHERACNAWYCLPEYAQGRKSVWTAINAHTGKRRIDEAFPVELRDNTNDNEMMIRFKTNGSTFQVVGSDQYDRTVGSSPALIIYSEWALANPSAWAYHRPILEENNGTALFITTPRGRNHAFDMYKHARQTTNWFCELLTAHDTGAMTSVQLAEALAEYRALYGSAGEAMWRQEYECDFSAALLGGFYSHEMAQVRSEGRISGVEPLPRPVDRAWDLGIGDDTSIWWFQAVGSQLFILDHYASSGVGLEHYHDVIRQREAERGWIHGTDYVPHDAKIKEWTSGRTRVETMQALGLRPMLVPLASIDDGINAVRRTLPLCVFHPRCEEGGISALEQYRREWDDEKKAFRASAVHDWTSHPADAFRYLAMSWRPAPLRVVKVPEPVGHVWRIPPPEEPRRGGIRL
jgi:phage terminase large subunit